MELKKAIEIATAHRELTFVDKNPDLKDAIKLLVEAGKRVAAQRQRTLGITQPPLPGETVI